MPPATSHGHIYHARKLTQSLAHRPVASALRRTSARRPRAAAPLAGHSAWGGACRLACSQRSVALNAATSSSSSSGFVGSPSYFASKLKTGHSYDEEAEGCYEAAAGAFAAALAASASASASAPVTTVKVTRSQRFAALIARRAESYAAARVRRASIRPSPGDLESMAAWVAEEDAAAAAAAVKLAAGRMPASRYPHLAAFLSARTGAHRGAVEGIFDALQRERALQERLPQAWQFTWDEEAHGGGALSSF